MNKKTLNIVLISLFIVGAIAFLMIYRPSSTSAHSSRAAQRGESFLTVEESAFDFGAISMAKGDVSHQFKIKNLTPNPVTITKMYTSCMCTNVAFYKGGNKIAGPFGMAGHGFIPTISKILGAGEEATMVVTFDPAAHGPAGIGEIERGVYIETGNGASLVFQIKANVTP